MKYKELAEIPGADRVSFALNLFPLSDDERERESGRREESKIRWIMGLTIATRGWNYGNHPYLICIKYGVNFNEIGPIWIFRGGEVLVPPF